MLFGLGVAISGVEEGRGLPVPLVLLSAQDARRKGSQSLLLSSVLSPPTWRYPLCGACHTARAVMLRTIRASLTGFLKEKAQDCWEGLHTQVIPTLEWETFSQHLHVVEKEKRRQQERL